MLGKFLFVAILCVVCADTNKRFLFNNQQSNPFQSPFGGGGTAESSYHPCTPQQGVCSLQCDYGYVKGPVGCDFCMCNTHHQGGTTTVTPPVPTTLRQVLSTKAPTTSLTASSPSSTKVAAPSASTTLSPCVQAQLACASSCGSAGYLIDPTDCTFCLCKESLG